MGNDKPNYYELLELATDASQSEVAKAYQKAKQTYDVENPALYSMFSPEEARELLKMIEEAYSVLGNSTLRREYDQSIGLSARPAGQPAAAPKPVEKESSKPAEQASHSSSASEDVRMKEQRSGADRRANPPASNQGKTQISTYSIDKDMEADIAARADFDGASLEKIRLYKNVSLERM
ncbi:MAG TPA: DnaJ domain-containing protein, partial [Bdellovibrionales bacterium]|nr:DnaJ domain-containing protein [Bdellovibrionales bacterium]